MLPEFLVIPGGAGHADDLRGKTLVGGHLVEGRKQLSPGEVTGGPEQHEGVTHPALFGIHDSNGTGREVVLPGVYRLVVPSLHTAKTLLLMRHGKSDWDADFERDHDRPLNERGMRSARIMGRLLGGLDSAPDLILTSTAIRARDTARLAADAGGWQAAIVEEPDFYGGGPASVLEIAARTATADRLMLVGHEPAWSGLAQRVSGRPVEMKTATIAVIELPIDDWSHLPDARGVIAAIHHPRTYFGSEWDTG